MKTVLLGGSNSVLSQALATGLGERTDLTNLALGATTALQNMCQIVRNEKEVAEADLVVTESNVNDIGCVKYFNNDMNIVKYSIDCLYQEMARVNRSCLILILPIQPNAFETPQLINAVNAIHVENAERHGFMIIDINKLLEGVNQEDHKFIRLDARHPLQGYMYHLGCNIGHYINGRQNELRTQRITSSPPSRFTVINSSSILGVDQRAKGNSRFSEEVGLIACEYDLPPEVEGKVLIGIGTWSDDISAIKITSGDETIIKPFNTLNSFNEVVAQPVLQAGSRISSFHGTMDEITEESIHMTRRKGGGLADEWETPGISGNFLAPVSLVNLLLMDPSLPEEVKGEAKGKLDLLLIAPQPQPYIRAIKDYVKRQRLFPFNNATLNRIIDSADVLADYQAEEARKLLKIALSLAPDNVRTRRVAAKIKQKLARLVGNQEAISGEHMGKR